MSNFTKADIDADIAMLTDKISAGGRIIPSNSDLLKKCFFIPVVSIFLSLISTWVLYFIDSLKYSYISSEGYANYLVSEGWVVLVPTAIIGLLFSFMAYNNLIMYLTLSEELRKKSLILNHLRKVVQKTVVFFLVIMILSAILSGFVSWLAFGVPAAELALFFIVNLVVGMEMNRLGAGLALEKISNLIKNI
ncbi:hypothetical protein SC171_16640 [Pantoea cypripedii]|uniref:hypothetical protein n=1 Tax=Pantoea cypripedii TaxID=55209 RepID=UPI002FCC2480